MRWLKRAGRENWREWLAYAAGVAIGSTHDWRWTAFIVAAWGVSTAALQLAPGGRGTPEVGE